MVSEEAEEVEPVAVAWRVLWRGRSRLFPEHDRASTASPAGGATSGMRPARRIWIGTTIAVLAAAHEVEIKGWVAARGTLGRAARTEPRSRERLITHPVCELVQAIMTTAVSTDNMVAAASRTVLIEAA